MKNLTLNVLVHYTDNGDGSNSAHLYNSEAELVDALGAYEDDPISAGNRKLREIESGDDPYENGTLNRHTLALLYDESTGAVSLARSTSLSSD